MGGKSVTTWGPVRMSIRRPYVTVGEEKVAADRLSPVLRFLAPHCFRSASRNDVQHFFHRWIFLCRHAPSNSSKATLIYMYISMYVSTLLLLLHVHNSSHQNPRQKSFAKKHETYL